MKQTPICFLTGASGVGKTTLVRNLEERFSRSGALFFHFDDIGVPSLEEMESQYGSGSAWQEAMTHQWVDRLVSENEGSFLVLEGQVNLQFIRDAFQKVDHTNYLVILIDCNWDQMVHRLTQERKQPELLTEDMKNWLTYLRNQALEFGVPILDTSQGSEEETLSRFLELAEGLGIAGLL